ncbi:MAG: hypothetical protein V1664_00040 [Candidatus Uhrbacteria bacterium]
MKRKMVGKLDVLDVEVIEQINDLPAFFHIASQTVRCPSDYAFILAGFEVVNHCSKQRSFIRDLGRFFFCDYLQPMQTQTVSKGFTFGYLVFDTPYLLIEFFR